MRASTKIGVAVIVLGVGVSLALMFPRAGIDATGDDASHDVESVAVGRPSLSANTVPAIEPPEALRPSPEPDVQKHAVQKPPVRTATPRRSKIQPLPEMPSRYGLSDQANVSRLPNQVDAGNKDRPANAGALPPFARPRMRTHRITDGDTLARIAQRYLGDARRYAEIQTANREVLANPDLLPIGAVLRIPPRDALAASDGQTETAKLVPVPQAVK